MNASLTVLGIDPGSNNTGWALLSRVAGRYALHGAGVIRAREGQPLAERLVRIHSELTELVGRYQPDEVAIEAIFKHRSAESALRLGHARGVALLVAASHGLPLGEYNPSTVKQTVGGHGAADKAQIQRLVQRLLGLDQPLAQDAADAAAIAITHLSRAAFQARAAAAAR